MSTAVVVCRLMPPHTEPAWMYVSPFPIISNYEQSRVDPVFISSEVVTTRITPAAASFDPDDDGGISLRGAGQAVALALHAFRSDGTTALFRCCVSMLLCDGGLRHAAREASGAARVKDFLPRYGEDMDDTVICSFIDLAISLFASWRALQLSTLQPDPPGTEEASLGAVAPCLRITS